jgi:hypothetical protein
MAFAIAKYFSKPPLTSLKSSALIARRSVEPFGGVVVVMTG